MSRPWVAIDDETYMESDGVEVFDLRNMNDPAADYSNDDVLAVRARAEEVDATDVIETCDRWLEAHDYEPELPEAAPAAPKHEDMW